MKLQVQKTIAGIACIFSLLFMTGGLFAEDSTQNIKEEKIKEGLTRLSPKDIEATQKKAEQLSKKMKVENVQEGRELDFDQEELQKRINEQLEKQKATWLPQITKDNPFVQTKKLEKLLKGEQKPKELRFQGEQIYILVSSSVPLQTLRNYMKSIERLNKRSVHLNIRGFINDEASDTMKWSADVALKEKGCRHRGCKGFAPIHINPLPFRSFNIQRVPAIVWSRYPAASETSKDEDYLVIYGDVSLEYALERFAKEGVSVAKELLKGS